MLFNSLEFLVYFPIVLSAYFITPHKFRWILLLLASYYFYMCWKEEYIILIVFSTLIDYFCGLKMASIPTKYGRKKYLLLSLFTNLGLLFFFKYFNLFNESFRELFNIIDITYKVPKLNILLPVGISFYTFQTLSYTIDIYNGKIKPEKHLGIFALYVSFFPQLVAGPIERARRLLPQFKLIHKFNYEMVRSGLALMLWGFFKKVVIADRIGEYVNIVFASSEIYKGAHVAIASFFFYIQLYCDFSGYSDIAIGAAGIMGYKLMLNFRQPLICINVQDFWTRWHISLTTWFRDYLYAPLKNNKKSNGRIFFSLFVVFLVTGFWHGANWTFLAFGGVHGALIILNLIFRPLIKTIKSSIGLLKYPVLNRVLNIVYTTCLGTLTVIFFRSPTIKQAIHMIISVFDFSNGFNNINLFPFKNDFYLSIGLVILLILSDVLYEEFDVNKTLLKLPFLIKLLLFLTGIALVILLGKFQAINFIYFQF